MHEFRRASPLGVFAAFGCVAAATLLSVISQQWLSSWRALGLLSLAVLISAVYAGSVAGLVATLASVLVSAFLFMSPTYSLSVNNPYDVALLTGFTMVGLLTSLFVANRRPVGNVAKVQTPERGELCKQMRIEDTTLTVCSACGRAQDPQGAWTDLAESVPPNEFPGVNVTLCPECADQLLREFRPRV